jgi:hypothetical protein
MPGWNGSGSFTLDYDWTDDAGNSIDITASRFDTQNETMRAGIESSLQKNGENAATADLPMGGFNHTGVGNGTARTEYTSIGQLMDGGLLHYTAGGTDTYTATPSPAISSYAAGQQFSILFTNANTGAATINLNGVGAKALEKDVSTALVSGEIAAGQVYTITYDGTRFTIGHRVSTASATLAGIVELATDAETNTGTATNRACTPANIAAFTGTTALTTLAATKDVGVNKIWVPAAAMRPTFSNGCAALTDIETTAGRPDMTVLDFDKDADEAAQFNIVLGNRYDGGTVTFQIYWTQSVGAVTTGVAFGLQGLATSDNESLDTAYGTAVVVTDDAQGAVEEVYISAASGAVTLGGTPADADYMSFRVYRDISDANDDLAGDARLLGVSILFTADQHNDA